MEAAVLEVKHLAADFWSTSFSGAQLSEVFRRARNDIFEEFKNDSAFDFAAHFDFEVDARIWGAAVLRHFSILFQIS